MELYDYMQPLNRLLEIQDKIKHVHNILERHYPVTIAEGGHFHIYDVLSDHGKYEFIKSAPCPFPIPVGVRAAFPLDCYDNKMSAIVTSDVFDTREGYVTILHEFVHFSQVMDCETELKDQLVIAQEYNKTKDYMWEINHPFPYDNQEFAELFAQYMAALLELNRAEVTGIRGQFEHILSKIDVEYLLWQEWKEGLARFIENKINHCSGFKENHNGRELPFSRVSFYESGSLFISLMEKCNSSIICDMKGLFYEMRKSIFSDCIS